MRRRLCALLLALAQLMLGGCALFPERPHGVERLLVVQALGYDREDDVLTLSMVSAADSARGEGPIRLSGKGLTISDAMEGISARTADEELFCAHTGHILIGEESARRGIGELLRYVCRSRELRMDVPLYIVRGGSAEDALLKAGDARSGAVEILEMLAAAAPKREGDAPPGVSRITGTLESGGCALAAAVRCVPSSEQGEDEELMTLEPDGYAVIADGALRAFIEEEDMAGLDFLTGTQGVHSLSVRDREGRLVTLRTSPGKTAARALRDDERKLAGLELAISLEAAVAEVGGRGVLSDAEYVDALSAAAESEVLRLAGRVVALERSLGADFLSLGDRLSLVCSASERERARELASSPGTLELRLTASVSISHSNDVRDG